MAEERIAIDKYDLDEKEWNGDIPIDIHKDYSRREAIEKMAKAQFNFMWQNKYSWKNVEDEDKKSFYKSAEVALNALLEEDK